MWQRGRCVLRHASSSCRACSISRGIADELSGFINRSSLPSSGRPTDISRTAQVKLSSLAANSQFCESLGVRFPGATHRNIYVRSEQAGRRVMESITRFITHNLKLKVNEAKSAVARPQERTFLGFSFTAGPEVKRVIAPKALDRFKRRIREITRRAKGISIQKTIEELASYMRGWR